MMNIENIKFKTEEEALANLPETVYQKEIYALKLIKVNNEGNKHLFFCSDENRYYLEIIDPNGDYIKYEAYTFKGRYLGFYECPFFHFYKKSDIERAYEIFYTVEYASPEYMYDGISPYHPYNSIIEDGFYYLEKREYTYLCSPAFMKLKFHKVENGKRRYINVA